MAKQAPKRAEIVRLRVTEGLSLPEIAAQMSITAAGVSVHLNKAQKLGELAVALERATAQ